jgi:hypothetical protein
VVPVLAGADTPVSAAPTLSASDGSTFQFVTQSDPRGLHRSELVPQHIAAALPAVPASGPAAAPAPARASRSQTRTALPGAAGGSPKAIAQSMLAARGWSGQYSCLDSLWSKESGWKVSASNPSGAYGIPQALPGSKMASAGPNWRSDPATQITWGLNYISSTYGSPCAAWSHSQADNWY